MESVWFYSYPFGSIGIAEEENKISAVFFGEENCLAIGRREETPLIQKTASELAEYFKGERQIFDIPLRLHGTAFQKADWEALQTIPYGQTRSYQQIAEQIGRPLAYRAVGMANHHNPVSILVPCHRVIGKNGSLTGYGGGIEIKKYLLELEKKYAG